MRVAEDIKNMREEVSACRKKQESIGFVPTMGALHKGHLSLIRRSAEDNDKTVVSIFVNPTQFNEEGDFNTYPRPLEEDLQKAEAAGADTVFVPPVEEMYSENRDTVVMVDRMANHLCGLSRGRGHFIGVCTVVTKLFNIVQPTVAYFGQKDAQQAMILQRMVTDLNLPLRLEICPTVREKDGLAMSSRNVLIPKKLRPSALVMYNALCLGEEMISGGESDVMTLTESMMKKMLEDDRVEVDYLNIVSPDTLEDVQKVEDLVLIAAAIKVGGVRLIDNVLVEP